MSQRRYRSPPPICWIAIGLGVMTWAAPTHAEDVVGAVVALDSAVDQPAVLREARRVAKGAWHAVTLVAPASQPRAKSGPEVVALGRLEKAYLEADFLRCMTLVRRPELDSTRLLANGLRRQAARVGVIEAACAHGARDLDLSRRLLRRVFTAGLATEAAFANMRPDFRDLAERVRTKSEAAGRGVLEVRYAPQDAQLRVDGGRHRCARSPCRVALLRGEHLITVERLGWKTRVLTERVDQDRKTTIHLEPASPAEARAQLLLALRHGVDSGSGSFAAAASVAYEAPVVLLTWRDRSGRAHASVYDRGVGRIMSRVSVSHGRTALVDAARTALVEWRGIKSPPIYKRPLFWATVASAAATLGVVAYLLTKPAPPKQYEIVFP